MKIVVLSDTHIAKIWDKIDKIIPEDKNALNPNEILKDTLEDIDEETLIVINGDIVDYFYTSYLNFRNSNWNIFDKILKTFKGKILLNKGNHDYRKAPYNFSIYGLKHINIPNYTRRLFSKKIGFNKFRFFKELQSISVHNASFKKESFFSRYRKAYSFKKSRLLFLNTGPDAITSPEAMKSPLNWLLLIKNPTISHGLSNKDIKSLEKELAKNEKKEVIIFLHCSPFNGNKNILDDIDLDNKMAYLSELIKYELTDPFFIKNNWKFIDMLIRSKANVIVVSSHSHISNQYIIDKEKRELEDSDVEEINSKRADSNFIKFITTLPLGAIEKGCEKIGYLVIEDKKIEYKVIKNYTDNSSKKKKNP